MYLGETVVKPCRFYFWRYCQDIVLIVHFNETVHLNSYVLRRAILVDGAIRSSRIIRDLFPFTMKKGNINLIPELVFAPGRGLPSRHQGMKLLDEASR